MVTWWNNIQGVEKVFWIIAIPFTAIFILQSILTLIGLDGHEGQDFHGELLGDIGHSEITQDISIEAHESAGEFLDMKYKFKLFTIRNIIVFFTIFAWTGIVATRANVNFVFTTILATLLGFIMICFVSFIYYSVAKFVENGTLDLKNALHQEGEVYLTIPRRRTATGKVQIVVQGALKELDAVTDGESIPTGSKIIVINIVDNQLLLVEKID